MSTLFKFDFQAQTVRVVTIGDKPWFVAKDLCNILEIKNVSDALSRLDDDEKNTIVLTDGTPGNPNTSVVSESGMYALVLSSRKPEAKPFRKWVTSEVLPSLRETGKYEIGDEVIERRTIKIDYDLPPADIRVANFISALDKIGFMDTPRNQSFIRDFVGDKILTAANTGNTNERWLGVAEKAEEMGYKASLVAKCRSQLGKWVKMMADDAGLEYKKESRYCHGTNRPIYIYRDSESLAAVISEYMGAKVLSSAIGDDELIG